FPFLRHGCPHPARRLPHVLHRRLVLAVARKRDLAAPRQLACTSPMATSGKRGAAARPSPRAQTHSPGSEDSRSLGSLPRNEAPRPAGISETTSPGSVKREAELVIADPEHVALADRPALHALAVVLDAVRRAHVHDVVAPVRE